MFTEHVLWARSNFRSAWQPGKKGGLGGCRKQSRCTAGKWKDGNSLTPWLRDRVVHTVWPAATPGSPQVLWAREEHKRR